MFNNDQNHVTADEDPLVSMPDSGDTGEGSKLKMIVQLVKKCLGVKDIASMRVISQCSIHGIGANTILAGGCPCQHRFLSQFLIWNTGITSIVQIILLR